MWARLALSMFIFVLQCAFVYIHVDFSIAWNLVYLSRFARSSCRHLRWACPTHRSGFISSPGDQYSLSLLQSMSWQIVARWSKRSPEESAFHCKYLSILWTMVEVWGSEQRCQVVPPSICPSVQKPSCNVCVLLHKMARLYNISVHLYQMKCREFLPSTQKSTMLVCDGS